MMKQLFSGFLLLFSLSLFAQNDQPPYTPAAERIDGFTKRQQLAEQSLFSQLEFSSIGPSVFSGRVVDLAIHPDDPSVFYVGYASGGLWKTESNGTHFEPLFDDQVVMTIGDIAVDWKRNTIWIGTGENNSSRSSYSGVGLFRSTDGGKTWEHRGLPESHHIGRIILHPDDPNTLWVAVLGHLYSPNEERGVYKTTDGGQTWSKTLYVNPNAGGIDLIIDPDDANTLYAATWHRERRAWNFVEAGVGSGIYKSTDGGNNWTQLNTDTSGFPNGEGVGRIGLDMVKKDGKTVLFAILDNYFRRPEKDKEDDEEGLTKDDLRPMSKADFLKLEQDKVADFLKNNNFPKKYSAEKVIKMVEEDKIKPLALVAFLEDANSLLFDTPVIGAEVYRSDDGGKSWTKTHEDYLNSVYNSYGYYFGQIRVAQDNPDKIYILGVPVLRSDDGGKNFKSINGDNVHVDHHALWVNPNRPGHLVLGNDGGVNISYDDGESWFKCNTPPLGQFYYVAVDMAKPYKVYGGLQDNGVWTGAHNYKASTSWHGSGRYPYKSIMGGDGMQVAIDMRDNNTVYTGFQFGNYYRINQQTGKRTYITPRHELGERPLRWNWQSPIHLSKHNQDILYMGSNKVHRSMNQGANFEEISEDLTTGGIKGDVAYSTLTALHESPLKFGLLYAGSDDGLIHVSKDGGNNWTKISDALPQRMWVSRIQTSKYKEGRVYATLNGYRWDDFTAYLYVSEDYGNSWRQLGAGLPKEPLNVVKEDPVNENILYVGSDHGLYVSLDRGATFMLLDHKLPAVAVHDLVVHPRENHLIVATHGRSFYKTDVSHLQGLDEELMAKDLHAFSTNEVRHSRYWGRQRAQWMEAYDPETQIVFYAKAGGKTQLTVRSADGQKLHQKEVDAVKGLNFVKYDMSLEEEQVNAYTKTLNEKKKEEQKNIKVKKADNGKYYLHPGEYEVELKKNSQSVTTTLNIKK
ncbi:MAG: glycosyl hydrolase [Bacteroidota bacterium]